MVNKRKHKKGKPVSKGRFEGYQFFNSEPVYFRGGLIGLFNGVKKVICYDCGGPTINSEICHERLEGRR